MSRGAVPLQQKVCCCLHGQHLVSTFVLTVAGGSWSLCVWYGMSDTLVALSNCWTGLHKLSGQALCVACFTR